MATSVSTQRKIEFELNGSPITVVADDESMLLDVIRDQCGVISPKNGCQPQGQCGCCAVLVDGQPKLACVLKAPKVAGKTVTTNEGLEAELRSQIADSFVGTGGVQCGFCIPGIVIRSVALLEKNPDPTRDEIAWALRPHLCRCTGYTKIIDAIETLACVRRGEPAPRLDYSGHVGTSLPRYAGADAVLGDRPYIDDMTEPGMLHGAVRLADHPRALVRAIDSGPAEALAGVERVITWRDVPGDRTVGLIVQDWPVFIAEGEETRCTGDVLAVVVARDKRTAREAAELIEIDYEIRTPVSDPRKAIEPDAPAIHPGGNILSESKIKVGDAEKALSESAHVVEGSYRTQRIEHMFLEPEACLAKPDGRDKVMVYSGGQGMFDDRRQIAKVLGFPVERVTVELVSNGGAFGAKEDMSIQAQTALAAHLCGAPVKIVLSREESFHIHPKRHPIDMDYRVGCDAEGRLTAVYARMIGDTGAYASVGAKVLERAAGHGCGAYRVPNVDIESIAAYTNNPPCGAMRGFGANQSAFAIESCLDRLAEKVGIDGWEIRWRNILRRGDRFATGQKLDKPFGLDKTLLAVKDAFKSARYAGIACGIKNVGIGNGMPDEGKVTLTVKPDGKILIRTGYTEMGQGLFTVCVQVACQETGLPPETFEVTSDTVEELNCGQTTASRGTVLSGNAIIEACKQLKADLESGKSLADLLGKCYRGEWSCTYTNKLGTDVEEPRTHLTYGFATQVVILDDDGRVAKVIAAHDVGKVINPLQLEGQMEGSIHMGLGYALTEDMIAEDGQLRGKKINDYGVLRAHQMPEIELIFIEEPDPECPYGARGVGEIGLVPTAPAVAGALYAFDGIRRTELPMKDSPAAQSILDPRWKPAVKTE